MKKYWILEKQLNISYVVFFSVLLMLISSGSVFSHEGSECDGIGPFGLPGLTLPPDQIGEWGDVIDFPVQATHSVVLHTGKVLFWRDTTPYLFDPVTETFAVTAIPVTPTGDLFCAGHATMEDGRIMVSGGTVGEADGIPYSEIFDPVAETWEYVSSMAHPRYYPTLTTLLDGRMLMTSGLDEQGPDGIVQIPEIYDPATNTWTELLNADRKQRLYPFMYALSDGTALDGGPVGVFSLDVESADPSWTVVTGLALPTNGSGESSAMYRPDKILKIGSRSDTTEEIIDRAVVLDLTVANPEWRVVAPMNFERRRADAVLLPNGKVMASGGAVATQNDHECAVHAAEIWDPDTEVFTQVASQALSRIYHSTSVLMPDGRILTAGGEGADGIGGIKTAEIYSPPYLFKGVRPTITSMASATNYGTDFQITTPDAASIVSVSALRPAAITHNFDQNQRYLPLDFTIGTGNLTVTAPAADLTPPGYYMLFLVNSNGSVSEAKFIQFAEDVLDTDSDGVTDLDDNCPLVANAGQENNDNDAEGDACDVDDDNDGLNDVDELTYGTSVFNPDSDGDTLLDGAEVNIHGTNPILADTDIDGSNDNVDNCPLVANAAQENNDGDVEGDACDVDDDNDGLNDVDEVTYGTDVFNPDSDGDNLLDGAEVTTHGTNPTLADTDIDGYNDDVEINSGSDPTDPASTPSEASPDGDINGDGIADTGDLILMLQFVLGLATPDSNQLVHADVAPLIAGSPAPDGEVNVADYLVLLRKVFGQVSF